MAGTLVPKQRFWELDEDDDGWRTYNITHLVKIEDGDGPFIARSTAGLPQPGDFWSFDNDVDPWSYCTFYKKVSIYEAKPGERPEFYAIEQKFTNKPYKRCQDTQIENPLLEPQKVSGSFEKYAREASLDKNGSPLTTSSNELHTGPKVEVDGNRPTVKISQNVALLELSLIAEMMGTLNDSPLWGLPARTIKLSSASWDRQVFGVCNFYYTRSFEFDIAYETFDRRVLNHSGQYLSSKLANIDYGILLSIATSPAGAIVVADILTSGSNVVPDKETPADPNATPPTFGKIKLKVLGRGKNGIVQFSLNSNGEVTGTATIIKQGIEYVSTVSSFVKTVTSREEHLPALIGRTFAPDVDNFHHFIKATDMAGHSMRVMIDAQGRPISRYENITSKVMQIYKTANLLLLNIPTSF